MKKRIEVRGVIVPSEYDAEWFAPYIDKGVITPESTVRLAAAGADGIDLYINSEGGSVFAGREMENAIRDNAKAGLEITVGAMAASAAANMVLSLGDVAKVRAHRNSMLMFHGASGVTFGGAGAHEDTKDMLDKINADIQARLVAKGIPAETVTEWFADGGAGWLTAEQAKAAGIVHEIIGEDAAMPDEPDEDVKALAAHGLDIAAFSALRPPVPAAAAEPPPPAETIETVSARLTAAHAEQMQALKIEHSGEVKRRDDLLAKMQGERDRAVSDLASAKKALEDVSAKLNELTANALGFVPAAEIRTAAEAIAACKGDYIAARKSYPDLFRFVKKG